MNMTPVTQTLEYHRAEIEKSLRILQKHARITAHAAGWWNEASCADDMMTVGAKLNAELEFSAFNANVSYGIMQLRRKFDASDRATMYRKELAKILILIGTITESHEIDIGGTVVDEMINLVMRWQVQKIKYRKQEKRTQK